MLRLRDYKKALLSSREKLKLFGIYRFILKLIEVGILAWLSRIRLRLMPSEYFCFKDFELLNRYSFETDNLSLSNELIDQMSAYNYRVFGKCYNFSSSELLGTKLHNLKHLVDNKSFEYLEKKYGHFRLHRWNYDPSNNYVFNELKIPYNKAEIKIAWEFGRFNLYPQLVLHSDDRQQVAEIFYRDFLSFLCENGDTKNNVQWANAMEAGIRIFNILVTASLLCKFKIRIPDVIQSLLKSAMDLHFKYIILNNEFSFVQTSNHFAANLLGLAAINTQYRSKLLNDILTRALLNEMSRNVHAGLLSEGSTSYHRFTSEIFLSTYLLLRVSGSSIVDKIETDLKAMADIVYAIENPLGLHTQFGDSDGGFLNWTVYPYSDKLDFYTPYVVENFRKFVGDLFRILEVSTDNELVDDYLSLANGSMFVIRSPRVYLVVNNIVPTINVYNKTHYHDDHGFVEFFVDGKAVSVDPGSYCYTFNLEARKEFQSSKAHYNNRTFSQIDNPFADFERGLNQVIVDIRAEQKSVLVKDRLDDSILYSFSLANGAVSFYIVPEIESRPKYVFLNYLSDQFYLD